MAFEFKPAPDRKFGRDFEGIAQEALLKLLDDLDEKKITREKFDAAAAALNRALAAMGKDEALEILKDAAVDDLISGETYKTIELALTEGGAGVEASREAVASEAAEVTPERAEAAAAVPELKIDTSDAEFDAILEARQAQAAHEMTDAILGTPEASRAVVEGAAPADLPLQDKEKAAEEFGSKEAKRELYLRVLDRIKNLKSWEWKELAMSAGAGGAARMAIRLAFGSSLGVGIAASALGGGITRGVREYRKERKQFTAESVLEKLRNAKSIEERAAVLNKAEEAHRKARVAGSEEELSILTDELRAARLFTDEEIEKLHADRNVSDDKLKILGIISAAEKVRKSIPKTSELRKDAEKFIEEVNFELKKVDRKKVATAVVKGAVAGVVGGAIASAVADWLHVPSHGIFGHGVSPKGGGLPEVAPPKLAMPQPIHVPSTEEAFRHQDIFIRKAEAASAATKEALEKAQSEILERKFGAVVEKGEGATHVARKIIHDYLVNEQKLNPDSFEMPSLEQLVYMEDTLKSPVSKIAEKGFHIGDHLDLTGENLGKVYQKAMNFKSQQLSNLKELLQESAHRISSKNVEMMTNLDDIRDSGNNFYGDVIKEAQEAAAKAAAQIQEVIPAPQAPQTAIEKGAGAVVGAMPQVHEAVQAPEVPTARPSASKILNLVSLYGGAAGGVGLGYGAYRLTSRVLKAAERTEVSEREVVAASEAVPPTVAPEAGAPAREEAEVSAWEGEGGALEAPEEEIDEDKKKKTPVRWEQPEKPKSTQAIFDKLVNPYKKKGVLISTVDETDKLSVIRRFPEIEKMVEEIGADKLQHTSINFFKPKYGTSARMFMGGEKKIRGVNYKTANVNIDSPIESIKKFIEENIAKKEQ